MRSQYFLKQILGVVLFLLAGAVVEAQPVWESEFPYGRIYNYDTAISVNNQGKLFMASGTNYFDGTIPIYINFGIYSSGTGRLLGANQVQVFVDEAVVVDIAVNSREESYVAATLYRFWGNPEDAMILKFDRRGRLMWSVTVPNTEARAVELDAIGNVLVGFDFFTLAKYDPNGTLIWQKSHAPSSGAISYLQPRGIKLDTTGRIYCLGWTENPTDFGFEMVKFDPNGNELWAQQFGGGITDWNQVKGSAFTIANDIYVSGPVGGSNPGILTSRISFGGVIRWQNLYPVTGDYIAAAVGQYRDPYVRGDGVVYVGGRDNANVFGIQLDARYGFQNWSVLYPGRVVENQPYSPNSGAVVDTCGNFFLPIDDGSYYGTELLILDPLGSGAIEQAPSLNEMARAVSADSSGTVFIGSSGANMRMAAAAFAPRGQCP